MYQTSGAHPRIGLFQLLPSPEGRSDGDVVAAALRDAVFAEERGFDSVWIAEHHASSFGLVGAPSVYAAAVAARTSRIAVGLAVAVVPLHHPLRLAEEIAWLTHVSGGRLLVGLGPGFSGFEFAAYGVPLEERHARFQEGAAIVRRLLCGDGSGWKGRFWTIPPVALRPRPAGGPPPLLRACSGAASAVEAARDGMGVLLGLQPRETLAGTIAAYRDARLAVGTPAAETDREIGRFRLLRRVVLAETASRAEGEARRALAWETEMSRRIGAHAGPSDAAAPIAGAIVGTPRMALDELRGLADLGIRHVIAWTSFGDLPEASVRRTMELLAAEVLPELEQTQEGECA
jgi:alkanesulfonate monooxygenase SsuD/methylene tetrahydromethanopterin reductase-like flavin-dependent oxidoreductase (luciferase family)